jgi:superfamily II DNA or RNA helicase
MPVDLAALQSMIARLRKRCPAPRFATGVELVRDGAVMLERESDDEAVLAVKLPDWPTPPTAVLYPESMEWACDCGGSDPCAHIVAGALALEASHLSGVALPSTSQVQSHLRYALSKGREGLLCERYLVGPDGAATKLPSALSEVTVSLSTSDADLAVDRALDPRTRAPLATLLDALSRCDDVRCDGVSVRVSTDPVLPRVTLDDHEAGFLLRIARDPAVTDELAPGVARCDDVLRPYGATELTGPTWKGLPRTQTFAKRDVPELVLERLPALRAQVPVEVRAKKLPKVARGVAPRVAMNATLLPHLLSVTPAVVYGSPVTARIEGAKMIYQRGPVPVRDPEAEVALVHRLRDELGLLPGTRADFRGDDAGRFLAKLKAWSAGSDTTASLFGTREVVPRFEATDTGFELTFELPRENGRDDDAPPAKADAGAVLTAWREGLDVVPLNDGGWAPLPASWLREHGNRVADLLAARDEKGDVPRAALPALAQFCDALEHPRPVALEGLRALTEGFAAIPDVALPGDVTATLRAYQKRGVDWLCFLRDAQMGAVLADDMGLGKTLQTICALKGRALVVAPRSVVDNWEAEIRRFRPSLKVWVYHGAGRRLDARADVTLTTYAVLRLDADALAKEQWDVVVLDEAQAIKNPDSQTARAAYALKGAFRVALSGTPVENRLEELWSLFHFSNPGLLGGRGDFDERYAAPIARGDGEAVARMRARTAPFILRRLKRDVAPELPARSEVVLRVDLDERERAVYDAVRAATRDDVVEALRGGGNTLAALEALLRLRQASCHAGLVPGQHADTSSKVACLVDALESAAADGHRALVFSQWTSLLDRVEPHLKEASVGFTRLDGSTRDRAEVVREFQSEGGPPVMLVSLKAGGTGLNLTAADHVFMLDPWWNPAVEDQAADRAHRIGQQRPVTVYRLVARDTVEERILTLQTKKRALAEAALDGGDPAGSLTRDDLLALLAD